MAANPVPGAEPVATIQPRTLFDAARMTAGEAMELTIQSLQAYGPAHDVWAIAFSGGKDSTALLTLVLWLLISGKLPRPKRLIIFYADTRLEFPALHRSALKILAQAEMLNAVDEPDWIEVEVVHAPLDKRFLVYILGRGVPPPNNATFRWCTRQIKVDPMQALLADRLASVPGKVLMLTGVREGESAARDARIKMSCGRDGAECGQGWYQEVLPEAKGIRGRLAVLAPLLHWRVCHVWEWLRFSAPAAEHGGWPTALLAEVYGGDEAEEINARTGCVGCPLVDADTVLDRLLRRPGWDYLRPLKALRPLWRELREPRHRLKKTGFAASPAGGRAADEIAAQDGPALAGGKNKQRMGPLTLAARRMALARVLAIQAEVNEAAATAGQPPIDLLNAEEVARIEALIAANTWPDGWDGDEPTADTPMDLVFRDGAVQPLLFR